MPQQTIQFSRAHLSKIIPPIKGRDYYRDDKQRGLLLDVQSSGVMSFQIYRKVNGRPMRINFGRFDPQISESQEIPAGTNPLSLVGNSPTLNVKMARKLATAINAELDKGRNPVETARSGRKAFAAELTLQSAFNLYCDDWLALHTKSPIADVKANFDRYLGVVEPGQKKPRGRERTKSPHGVNWSKRKISSLKPEDIRRLQKALSEGHGVHTANRTFELLRAMFNKLIEWKIFSGAHPCEKLNKFREVSRERFLKGDELPRFFENLAKLEDEMFKDFVLLLLMTGQRRKNVLGMRWSDVDLTTGLWTVPWDVSKNGSPIVVTLIRITQEIIKHRKQKCADQSDFVFPAKSKTGYMTSPNKKWAALLKSSGIENLHIHDMRRSMGSWQAMTGASLAIIGKSLGHKSAEATMIYARLQTDPVRDSMERAAAEMLSKAGYSFGEQDGGTC